MKTIIPLFLLSLLVGCGDDKPVLHVYNWADYIDQSVISEFEEKNGCHVCIDSFDSNESMFAKLKAGASGYDVIFPSSYMVNQLAGEGMILKLDHSKLPNVKNNFDHKFDTQVVDAEMNYSVPYAVTYTGIMYLKDNVKNNKDISWDIFNDPSLSQRMSMLYDIREVIGIGLMYNGFSLNSENPEEISKAVKTLKEWKKNIRKFDAESYKVEIATRALTLGHAYSTDSFQVIIGDNETESRHDIGFALPKEGFTIAFDEMCIMKNSKNQELSYKFIDFMYDNEMAYKNMTFNFAPVPNKVAISKLPEEMKKIIILDDETIKRGQVMKQFRDQKSMWLYSKAWDDLKSNK